MWAAWMCAAMIWTRSGGLLPVVLQKNLLFSGTIKENLRWGNPDAGDEELEQACRLAQADDFIRSFPDGYDSKIEQGGTNVSAARSSASA